MKTEAWENQLRAHLLGTLPEAEQTALEEALLRDRDQFEKAWDIENELVDAYVRNELPAIERQQFEQHYLASSLHRERVATAKQLLQAIEPSPIAAIENGWWRKWLESFRLPSLAFGGTFAAALLCLSISVLWLWRERVRLNEELARLQQAQAETLTAQQRAQELAVQKQTLENELTQERQRREETKAELERLRQQPAASAPALLSFLLTPGATRSNSAAPPVIPLIKQRIQLLLPLAGDNHFNYQATLQTVEGQPILSQAANRTADRAFAAVTLPARQLNRDDYVLILSGRTASGVLEELDRFFFRLQ